MKMKFPQIEINGKTYEMQEPRARMWRTFAEFDEKKRDLSNAEFIEKHCEVIASVFSGVTVEELLDNLVLSDVLKLYRDCYICLSELMTSKLRVLEKNSADGVETAEI